MFPQHPMNNLIYDKLKRLLILQDIIKIDNLSQKAKNRKVCDFCEYSLTIFLRDIHV